MTPPRDPEPPVVEPDDLLALAQQEAAATAPAEPDPEPPAVIDVIEPGTEVEVAPPAPGLVPITSEALQAFVDAEWNGFESGLENWNHVGFSIPRIVSDMRPGGGWTDEVTGETAEALHAIILAAMPARAWWAHEFGKGDAAPDCRSVDMVKADPSSPALSAGWEAPDGVDVRPTGTCSTCPLSRWDGQDAPGCRDRINMLIYLPGTGEIRRLNVSGTSVKHLRKYVSSLQARAARKPIFAQITIMTAEKVEQDGMKWLEAHFAEGDPVTPQEAAQTIVPLQRQLVEQWRSILADDLASPEADGTAVARGDALDVQAYGDEEPF